MRARALAAGAVVLALAGGCRATQWPSDADQARFCRDMTGTQFTESGIDEPIIERGTPANLPFEARRYLLDLAEDKHTDPEDERVFDEYVATYC